MYVKRDIVYFDPSIPKVLCAKLLKPIWNDVVFSTMGPVKYKKAENIQLVSEDDVLNLYNAGY